MDKLGSYPLMDYSDNNQYSRDADQEGSWFGLAISGLRFLINNQRNHNINHDYQSSNLTSISPNNANTATKHHNSQSKLHILGPSVFKKQLYDIPEYQSTASSKSGETKNANRTSLKTSSRLTKRALQQFNGNFSNYWNQRSSLHQTSEAGSTDAPSVRSKRSHFTNTRPVTDGGSSTVPRPTEEYEPSMASSQIIHPTQDKPQSLKRSRSFPLLHSAENIEKFGAFSRENNVNNIDAHYFEAEQGSQGTSRNLNYIPSPPPISNSAEVMDPGFMFSNLKEVHPMRSWGSGPSTNDEKCSVPSVHSNDTDGIVFIDNYNLKIMHQQKVKRSMSALKLSDLGTGSTTTTGSGTMGMMEEVDWEQLSRNETLSMILKPLPRSIRKKKNKKSDLNLKRGMEEEASFSDWSNVSSNIGVPSNAH